jgi:type II secretory pathway component PulC
MTQDNLIVYVMAFFVLISAIAMCIQAGLLYGIYKTSRTMQESVSSVLPQTKSMLAKAETILDDSRTNIVEITRKGNEITQKANDIMDLAKAQMVKVDSVITDASTRAKSQLERAEMVVDDAMTRVNQSVAAVHNGIVSPIRQINGVATGVSTAISVFMRGGRPSVAQATQDDEMFI